VNQQRNKMMKTIVIHSGLRFVLRDGEKVLQEYIDLSLGQSHFPIYGWKDLRIVDEKTGEDITDTMGEK
jgi:hypothetical protein